MNIKALATYGLTFVGGAALGSGVAYLIMRHRFQTELDRRLDEEMTAYEEKMKGTVYMAPHPFCFCPDDGPGEENEPSETTIAVVPRKETPNKPDHNRTAYHHAYVPVDDKPSLDDLVPDYPREDPPEEEDEEFPDGIDPDPDYNPFEEARQDDIERHPEPFFIDEDEYIHDYPQYDKLHMTYWEGDDTFSDEEDSLVDMAEVFFGTEIYGRLRAGEQHNRTVYVRNHQMGCDVELVVVEGGYGIHMMTDDSPNVEKIPKRKSRPSS